jgi:multidrug efflux pump subunit AcrA (membrane-fusion protein)
MRNVFLIMMLLIVGLALTGCAAESSVIEPTPTPVPTAVKPTFKVQRGDIVIETDIGGRVMPANSKPVRFALDGEVGNVYVQVGDYVEPSQLLADLKIIKELETEWATVSTQAKYEETISTNTLKRAEIKLQLAQLALEDLKAKGVSDTEVKIAELQVELAQMDLDEVLANPVLHESSTRAKQLEQALIDAQLKAPFAGYVVEAPNPGKAVKTTSDAFQIGDTSELEIGATVLEEVLKQLTEGMTVTVVFEGTGNKQLYTGVIRQLPYPYGNGTNGGDQIRVKLDQSSEQGGYSLGDRAVVSAVLQQKNGILWLPPQAIRTVGGRTLIVVQEADGQKRIEITPGLQTHDRVEITGNVGEGQVVIGP